MINESTLLGVNFGYSLGYRVGIKSSVGESDGKAVRQTRLAIFVVIVASKPRDITGKK